MKNTFKILTEETKKEIVECLQKGEMRNFIEKTKAAEDTGNFEVVISTADLDRQGEIIDQAGWELDFYRLNPVVLWAHDYFALPIGITDELKKEGDKLIAKGRFAPEEANPFAQQVRRLYDLRIVRATSVGYIPKEYENNKVVRAELLEFSFVPVPANPLALTLKQAESLGLNLEMLALKGIKIEKLKGAVASHEVPKADEDTDWDADAAVQRILRWAGGPDKENVDWAKFRQGFAWYDEGAQDNITSYKLPHHDIKDGELKVIWRGTAAAMTALMGARGGVDIPDADWDGVYNHLARHYRQFDKEPPEKSAKDTKPEPETEGEFIIIRVKDPDYFDPDSFRTIDISEEQGIKATIGCKKGEYKGGKCNIGTEVQRYLFDKDKWTLAEAQAWVEEHKSVVKRKNIEKIGAELSALQSEIDDAIVKHSRTIIEILQTEYGEETEKTAALTKQGGGEEDSAKKRTPKQRSSSAGFDMRALNEWLVVRQVLREINNLTSSSLQKFNERARKKQQWAK